ncbi:MAG: FtsQ-type POTRA domain-containing protein [Acidobacteria bacterium]|nr:FtsQ-type POTRA domain-containing protein [Acidobacteriota bacterium]
MALLDPPRKRRPWVAWLRVALVLAAVGLAGWGALELGQRYLGLQKLTIEQVAVNGCRGERLREVQGLADRHCLGRPLFLFDAEGLRAKVLALRWVKGLTIRKDPPDRLTLMIEERQPLVWLVHPRGIFLVSEDGVLMDRVGPGNLTPIPVVAEPASQADGPLLGILRAAKALRERQRDFYDRITEFRWSGKGPVAYIEGLGAPIYLSAQDPTRNVPNFQALYLSRFAGEPKGQAPRYFDLRWSVEGGYVAVGNLAPDQAPASRTEGN